MSGGHAGPVPSENRGLGYGPMDDPAVGIRRVHYGNEERSPGAGSEPSFRPGRPICRPRPPGFAESLWCSV